MDSASIVGGVGKTCVAGGSDGAGVSNSVVSNDVVMIVALTIEPTPYFSVFTNSSMLTGNFGFTSA